ncbi:MAG TPA: META domain-containing protein, partial [Alphaproteobacteria bacterium]|nr:META domain-containing protein [Alphaproteobacteria bacterium]
TKLACLSDIATAQEQAFFDALAAARFWRSDGSTLVLLDAAGVQVVRFVRVAR